MTKSIYLINQLKIYFKISYLMKLLHLTTEGLDKQPGQTFNQ